MIKWFETQFTFAASYLVTSYSFNQYRPNIRGKPGNESNILLCGANAKS